MGNAATLFGIKKNPPKPKNSPGRGGGGGGIVQIPYAVFSVLKITSGWIPLNGIKPLISIWTTVQKTNPYLINIASWIS